MAAQSEAFDKAIGQIIAPALAHLGFRPGRGRTFRRFSADGTAAEIVNFQLGQRSLAGRFSVNLGLFLAGDAPDVAVNQAKEYNCSPARRSRLGLTASPRFPRLAALPLVGLLLQPRDKWWRAEPGRIENSLSEALQLLLAEGLPWLQRVSPNNSSESTPLRGSAELKR